MGMNRAYRNLQTYRKLGKKEGKKESLFFCLTRNEFLSLAFQFLNWDDDTAETPGSALQPCYSDREWAQIRSISYQFHSYPLQFYTFLFYLIYSQLTLITSPSFHFRWLNMPALRSLSVNIVWSFANAEDTVGLNLENKSCRKPVP